MKILSYAYVDQFILDKLDSLVSGFLSDSNFLKDTLLPDLPTDIVNSFIDTYCSDGTHKGINIPVVTTFPQQNQGEAFILVQFKQGVEDQDKASIGNVQGSIARLNVGADITEKLPVLLKEDNNETIAYLQPTKPPAEIYSVHESTYFNEDEDGLVEIPYFDFYKDKTHYYHISYAPKLEDVADTRQIPKGMVLSEQVAVDFCATNIDVLRCMTSILSAIQVYLKDALNQNSAIDLPTLSLEGTDLVLEVNDPTTSISGQQVYYRRMNISFTTVDTVPINTQDPVTDNHINVGLDEVKKS